MPTPHISAAPGDFAPDVLMPGDPKRARWIAENYLEDVRQVTDVRSIAGFTGTHDGHPVSVMASGMGIPSAAIYATELIREYGVRRILRIGTAGAYTAELPIRSLVAIEEAVTNSRVPELLLGRESDIRASAGLLEIAQLAAGTVGVDLRREVAFTTDIFYDPDDRIDEKMRARGVGCVEMEAAGLYAVAEAEGVDALALVTITDHFVTGERLTSEERQLTLDTMIRVALEMIAITAR